MRTDVEVHWEDNNKLNMVSLQLTFWSFTFINLFYAFTLEKKCCDPNVL